jgi:hypothetical protein
MDMTDKRNHNRDSWLPRQSDSGEGGQQNDPGSGYDGSYFTREEWEMLSSDPKWKENLGYEICEWEEFATLDDSDMLMYLPTDERVLREDAFVVAAENAVVDLGSWY